MIAFDKTELTGGKDEFCAFAGLRDGKNFVLSHDDIMQKYGDHIKMTDRLPDVLATAMGNQMYMAIFPTKEEMDAFYNDILACKE